MTTEEMEQLRGAMTQGPWFARETYVHDKHVWFDAEGSRQGETPNVAFDCDTEENARAIALTPDLLAEVLELRAANERLRDALYAFAFFDDDDPTDSTQKAWERIYQERVQDWISFEEIDAARALTRKDTA